MTIGVGEIKFRDCFFEYFVVTAVETEGVDNIGLDGTFGVAEDIADSVDTDTNFRDVIDVNNLYLFAENTAGSFHSPTPPDADACAGGMTEILMKPFAVVVDFFGDIIKDIQIAPFDHGEEDIYYYNLGNDGVLLDSVMTEAKDEEVLQFGEYRFETVGNLVGHFTHVFGIGLGVLDRGKVGKVELAKSFAEIVFDLVAIPTEMADSADRFGHDAFGAFGKKVVVAEESCHEGSSILGALLYLADSSSGHPQWGDDLL